MTGMSRRDFVAMTATGTMVTPFVRTGGLAVPSTTVERDDQIKNHDSRITNGLTALAIVDRIKANIGVEWRSDEVDTFKAGDPSTIVTGVVTTSMATLDVLQKAVQAGANLIITAAPTFYSRADLANPAGRGAGAGDTGRGQGPPRGGTAGAAPAPTPATVSGPGTGASAPMPPAPAMPQSVVPAPAPGAAASVARAASPDPVYAGKNTFIDKHKLVVFRLTQHWNQRTPDPRAQGLARAMGWTRLRQGSDGQAVRQANGGQTSNSRDHDSLRYDVPAITLDALASQLKKALGTRGGVRAIGDRRITVHRIGLLPGYTLIQDAIAMLPTVDAIITGEVQEWESAAYAQDVAFAGIAKGLISIGRVVNEAAGMQVCADWLKTIVPDVPVRFIPAGDPYWRPV